MRQYYYCPVIMKFIVNKVLHLLRSPIHCVVLHFSCDHPRDRKDTCSDSFGRSTPQAALVFCGTWRRRQTTSSRSNRLASMGKAKRARRSIFEPSRSQTASPPTALIKVSSSENNETVGCHCICHLPPWQPAT